MVSRIPQEARPYQTADARGPVPDSFWVFFLKGKLFASVKKMFHKKKIHYWLLGMATSQLPAVEGAIVSLNPKNGAIFLVGGLDFKKSKFNRVTQANDRWVRLSSLFYTPHPREGYTADP